MNTSATHHTSKPIFRPRNAYEKILRLIHFEEASPLNILDIGSGSGLLAKHLETLGHRVTCLDTFLPENKPQRFILCDIEKTWPVDDQTFDIAIATDVPEHLISPEHILTEAQRVLKKGGRLIFGVPNHFDLRQRIRTLLGHGIVHWDNLDAKESAWNYAHIRFFTLPELLDGFKKHHWDILVKQFNFMGGGIIPTRFTPTFFRIWLLSQWPTVFSGKFIFLLSLGDNHHSKKKELRTILIPKTPPGL